jgi:ferredoxin
MADKANKYSDNVPGKYYVDNQCIDCDQCCTTAPDTFKRNEAEGHAFVHQQPRAQQELDLADEAKKGCPVDAIGDDGE